MEVLLYKNDPLSDSDRLLREKAGRITEFDGDIKKAAGEMLEIMNAQKGVGLAGPQVGLLKRIFVSRAEGDKARVFINPAIIGTSQELVKYEEGCLSLPGLWADVTRPEKITVQAWNEQGRAFTMEASGILARVILHEYDHLEGILFIDRIAEAKREKILSRLGKPPKKGRV